MERVTKVIHDETRWCVVGPDGGVDFHCTSDEQMAKWPESIRDIGRMGGLEFHHRTPADYQEGKAADFDKCWLLDGPCWCDGTSMVRCKFKCASKREYRGWNGSSNDAPLYEYEFNPVIGGSDENKSFFAATPAGSLKVSTVTDGRFEVGKEYYLDLSAA